MWDRKTLSFVRAACAAVALFLSGAVAPSLAVEPDEILEDPALEARARDISRELRCVTCQSQSIDDSNAPLAKDLRLVVRERLLNGDTDDEVIAYVSARYGDYVRLKPALRGDTLLLWLAPGLALAGALTAAFFYFRQLPQPASGPDDDEIESDADA
ncbi:MAG: cytochrome c-type biogenesis protein [Hyphococcus sp.]